MPLDRGLADAAIARFADRLGMTPNEAAESVVRVAVSNMYAEFTKILSRAAVDPRDFALVAFGGGGPVVGALLAREVGIPTVFVPRSPGTLCALGAISADIVNDAVRTVHVPVDAALLQTAALRERYDVLRAELADWLERHGAGTGARRIPSRRRHALRRAVVRDRGAVELAWLAPGGETALLAAFHRAHERVYGHADREAPAEIVNLACKCARRARASRWARSRSRRRRLARRAASGSTAVQPMRASMIVARSAVARASPVPRSSSSRTRRCSCPTITPETWTASAT